MYYHQPQSEFGGIENWCMHGTEETFYLVGSTPPRGVNLRQPSRRQPVVADRVTVVRRDLGLPADPLPASIPSSRRRSSWSLSWDWLSAAHGLGRGLILALVTLFHCRPLESSGEHDIADWYGDRGQHRLVAYVETGKICTVFTWVPLF